MNFGRIIIVFLFAYAFLCFLLLKFYKAPTTYDKTQNLRHESLNAASNSYEISTPSVDYQLSSAGGSNSTTKKYQDMTPEERLAWCQELSSSSIYSLGSKLQCNDNSQMFSLAIMIAVLLTIVIEVITHRVEHRLRNKTHKTILMKVYKELMMMGLINFGVITLESTSFFDILSEAFQTDNSHQTLHEITERRVKIFELVHVMLFVLSILYVIVVVASFFILRSLWRKWKAYEQLTQDRAFKTYIQAKQDLNSLNLVMKLLSIRKLWHLIDSMDKMHYWSVRSRFVQLNRLKKDFRFDIYLKHRLRILYADIVEVGVKTWAVVLVFALINYFRLKVVDFEGGGLLSFALLFGLGSTVIYSLLCVFFTIAYLMYVKKYGYFTKYQAKMYRASKYINDEKTDALLPESPESAEATSTETSVKFLDTTPTTSETTFTDATPTRPKRRSREFSFSIRPSSKRRSLTVLLNEVEHIHPYNYFVLRSPEFSFLLLQFFLLVQCFYIAMILTHFTYIIFREYEFHILLKSLILVSTFVPSILVCGVFFPWTIAPFTMLSSVDSFTNKYHVRKAIELARMNNSNDYDNHETEAPYFISLAHNNKRAWQIFVKKLRQKKRLSRQLHRKKVVVKDQNPTHSSQQRPISITVTEHV